MGFKERMRETWLNKVKHSRWIEKPDDSTWMRLQWRVSKAGYDQRRIIK